MSSTAAGLFFFFFNIKLNYLEKLYISMTCAGGFMM